jgi:hypothetical protein
MLDFPANPTDAQIFSGPEWDWHWRGYSWRRTAGAVTTPPVADITVTSIAPTSFVVGAAAFTLAVTGTNFTAASVIVYNGANVATTFVSATRLTAQVTPPATAGTATVNVTDAVTANFTITYVTVGGGLTPVITNVTPASVSKAAGTSTVTLTGDNFHANQSVASYNGNSTAVTTTVVSKTQITCQVDGTFFPVGSGSMMVINGGIRPSNSWPFSVTA